VLLVEFHGSTSRVFEFVQPEQPEHSAVAPQDTAESSLQKRRPQKNHTSSEKNYNLLCVIVQTEVLQTVPNTSDVMPSAGIALFELCSSGRLLATSRPPLTATMYVKVLAVWKKITTLCSVQ
jgi:hypothetical protein